MKHDTAQHLADQVALRGSVTLIVGRNGAGKTALLERLAGPGVLTVDDVGAGLDYVNAGKAARELIAKAKADGIRLVIMATCSRDVMNTVPLMYWSILEDGRVINATTHPRAFEDFEFTGLCNFDFFSTRFWDRQPLSRPHSGM